MVRASHKVTGSSYGRSALASCSHTCASVTKLYKLVPFKGRWCPATGKVTVGLTVRWACSIRRIVYLSSQTSVVYSRTDLRKWDEHPAYTLYLFHASAIQNPVISCLINIQNVFFLLSALFLYLLTPVVLEKWTVKRVFYCLSLELFLTTLCWCWSSVHFSVARCSSTWIRPSNS